MSGLGERGVTATRASRSRRAIHDFLYSDDTGLPLDSYTKEDVIDRTEEVFRHIYRAYPTLPSPYYQQDAA